MSEFKIDMLVYTVGTIILILVLIFTQNPELGVPEWILHILAGLGGLGAGYGMHNAIYPKQYKKEIK